MVIIIALQRVWCGPGSLKFVFMRPSKLLTSLIIEIPISMSLMRPVSQFEFETPALEGISTFSFSPLSSVFFTKLA